MQIAKINLSQIGSPNRKLMCDICNLIISDEKTKIIYISFWKNKDGKLFLEKYICPKCYNKYYKNKTTPITPFEKASIKNAILKDFKKNYYGILVPMPNIEKIKILLEKPDLLIEYLKIHGEKF